jgi:hypothetical protein
MKNFCENGTANLVSKSLQTNPMPRWCGLVVSSLPAKLRALRLSHAEYKVVPLKNKQKITVFEFSDKTFGIKNKSRPIDRKKTFQLFPPFLSGNKKNC